MVSEKYTDPEEGGPAKKKGSQKVYCSANVCKKKKFENICSFHLESKKTQPLSC